MAEHAVTQGRKVDIKESLNLGFSTFFKSPITFMLTTILWFIIATVMNFVPLAGQLASAILLPIFTMGFSIQAHRSFNDSYVGPGALFEGMKGAPFDKMVISFLFLIINSVLVIATILTFKFITDGQIESTSDLFNGTEGSFYRKLYLIIIFILVFGFTQTVFFLSLLYSYFKVAKASVAITAAIVMVKNNYIRLLAVFLILFTINCFGAVIPFAILATIPISFATIFFCFLMMVDRKEELEEDIEEFELSEEY